MTNQSMDVFQFLALRSPEKLDPIKSRWLYVRDDEYHAPDLPIAERVFVGPKTDRPAGCSEVNIFSPQSPSPVARKVATELFTRRSQGTGNDRSAIVSAVETLLVSGLTYGSGSTQLHCDPTIQVLNLSRPVDAARSAALIAAGSRLSYLKNQRLHVLPDSLSDLVLPLSAVLVKAEVFLTQWAQKKGMSRNDWRKQLLTQLPEQLVLPTGARPLVDMVFHSSGVYSHEFGLTKRVLFDVLYGLYILRRREDVNLEPVMRGLTLCHVLEGLAIAEYFESALAAQAAPSTHPKLYKALWAIHPELVSVNYSLPEAFEELRPLGLLGPTDSAGLNERLQATPVIHPLLARLSVNFTPFNSLKSVGLGDLKVVKQTFRGYRKGEIAHIETVLKGETKKRTHRSLDRLENSFDLTSSTDSETAKDSQSTSRFELKNEAEQVIKTDIGLNANASFTYKGNPVLDASLTAGASFSNSHGNTERSAKNFVSEVISKATSRVQSRVSNQRNQTRISEVEETTLHKFANTAQNSANVSGMYRWLDKVYEGQVYDFGKRTMFEFMLPEPAEFYVEARLHAHTAELEIPRYPMPATDAPPPPGSKIPAASEIDEAMYATLSQTYDLSAYPYPAETLSDVPLKTITNELTFQKRVPYDIGQPTTVTESFTGKLNDVPTGYTVSAIRINGTAKFAEKNELAVYQDVQNTIDISLNEFLAFHRADESTSTWNDINTLGTMTLPQRAQPEMNYFAITPGMTLGQDVRISIFTKTCLSHELAITINFTRSTAVLQRWQLAVYNEISRRLNQGSASAGAEDLASRRITYQKALDELKAKSINEIIQGRSEAWNEQQVRRELKRQCLSLIAKEFDEQGGDDLLPSMGGVGIRYTDVAFPVFGISDPVLSTTQPTTVVTEAVASFEDRDSSEKTFAAIQIDQAKARGRLIQFLEQAFEWNQLSYIFYPYFWARMPQWIQLMNREDPSDPMFTEFLQSGSARVLLAVKPGYENAVVHFLSTREPWGGGPSPVIADQLYLPLYEEVRNRQDDLAGATPVGEPWEFSLPTSLVYLESENDLLVMPYPLPRT